jgi:hypothetical protein
MCKCFDLKQKISWSAWQFGVLKLCMLTLGIICGAYFADFFRHCYVPLWIVVAITWSFSVAWWFRAQEANDGSKK